MKALELVTQLKEYNRYETLASQRDLNGEDYSIPDGVDLDVKALHSQYAKSHIRHIYGQSELYK